MAKIFKNFGMLTAASLNRNVAMPHLWFFEGFFGRARVLGHLHFIAGKGEFAAFGNNFSLLANNLKAIGARLRQSW